MIQQQGKFLRFDMARFICMHLHVYFVLRAFKKKSHNSPSNIFFSNFFIYFTNDN